MSSVTAASPLEYGAPITLSAAKQAIASAEAAATANHLTVIIAIVDSAAQLLMLQRMDHAQFGSIPVAIANAESAVKFKRPTKIFEDALAAGDLGLRLLSIEGGVRSRRRNPAARRWQNRRGDRRCGHDSPAGRAGRGGRCHLFPST